GVGVHAQVDDAAAHREDRLKAAYLFNFAKFVEWPGLTAAQPLTICFMGGAGVYASLALDLDNKTIGGHKVQLRQLEDEAPVQGCAGLHWHARPGEGACLFPAADLSVLTVGDSTDFTDKGGMIALYTDSNRLRFNVNVDNVRRAGLRISSSLLELAAS